MASGLRYSIDAPPDYGSLTNRSSQEPHANTLYKHFYFFVTEHNMVSAKELEALVRGHFNCCYCYYCFQKLIGVVARCSGEVRDRLLPVILDFIDRPCSIDSTLANNISDASSNDNKKKTQHDLRQGVGGTGSGVLFAIQIFIHIFFLTPHNGSTRDNIARKGFALSFQ